MKWDPIQLGDVMDVKHGYAFKSKHFSDTGDLVLLTPGNCYESGGLKLKGNKEKYYVGEFPPEFLLDEGEMLVVMTDLINTAPILGGSFIIPDNNKFLHNQRLGLVQVTDEARIDKTFLYFLLNTYDYRAQVRGSASGATVRHTSPGRIRACKVRVPREVNYQREITAILSAYDDLIENNHRRMALLEDAARQLYREWFVRLRFPGHEHTKIVDGVPEGWERVPFLDIAIPTYGHPFQSSLFTDDGEGLPLVRIRDVLAGESKTFTLEEAPPDRRLQNGDMLIGMDGDFHMGLWAGGEAWLNQRVVRIKSKGAVADYLLFNLLEEPICALNETITGTTVVHLGAKELKEIRLFLPSLALLSQANDWFTPLGKQLVSLKLQNRQLRAARDLLLPRLMSGEITV